MNFKFIKLWTLIQLSKGFILVIFGLSFYFMYYHLLLQYLIENHLFVLKPGSLYNRIWSRGAPLKTKIYIFELTNGLAFLRGQKPTLREHGPFVFNVMKTRHNITWLEGNRKVSFYEKTIFIFNRQESVADLRDYNITIVNLPFVAIMNQIVRIMERSSVLNLLSPIANTIMKNIMSQYNEALLERRTPYEIICGRKLEMFQSLEGLLKPMAVFSDTIAKSLKKIPKKIGYLSQRNNTMKGPIVMYTGVRDFSEMLYEFDAFYGNDNLFIHFIYFLFNIERKRVIILPQTSSSRMIDQLEFGDPMLKRKSMEFYSIKRKRFNSYYTADSCNKIEGSDGTVHDNLLIRARHNLKIYIDICRRIDLVYNQREYFSKFLPLEQYTFDPYTFSMAKEDNWCYCKDFRYSTNGPNYSIDNGMVSFPSTIASTQSTKQNNFINNPNRNDNGNDNQDKPFKNAIERNGNPSKEIGNNDSDLCRRTNTPHLRHSECRQLWIKKILNEIEQSRLKRKSRWKRSIPNSAFRTNEEEKEVQFTNSTTLPKVIIKHPILKRCDGYHDMEGCYNAPVLVTFPHFLYSQRFVKMMKNGIKPDSEKHKSRFNIDPLTGLSLKGEVKLQINLRMNPSNAIAGYDRFGATMMPFVWFNEGGQADSKQALKLTIFLSLLYCFKYVWLLFSGWGLFIIFKAMKTLLTDTNNKKLNISNRENNPITTISKNVDDYQAQTARKSLQQQKIRNTFGKDHKMDCLKNSILLPNQMAAIRNHRNNRSKSIHYPTLTQDDEWKFSELSKIRNATSSLDGITIKSINHSTNSMAPIE